MNDLASDFRRFRSDGNLDRAHANLLQARKVSPEDAARQQQLAERWGVGFDTARMQQPLLEDAARAEADKLSILDAPKTDRKSVV